MRTDVFKDFSLSASSAGMLAVLISYSGPLIIFFQAGQVAGVSEEMMSSWIWAVSLGAAISGIVLSLWLKVPIVTAWSAPGTALLISLFPELSLSEAVGAYITAGIIICLISLNGWFDYVVNAIPKGICHAMLAGILFQFGVQVFSSVATLPLLSLIMLLAYLIYKRFLPKYSLLLVLITSLLVSYSLGLINTDSIEIVAASPQFIIPEWSLQSTLSLALPLVIVSLSGQFLPGLAIIRTAGYAVSSKPIVLGTGLISIPMAFFGGITTVIAAITAAICTGKDAHPEPDKRYIAGISNGVFYLIGALMSGTIITLFTALPSEFVAVLAGLALFSAISSNLAGALREEAYMEASVITFLATASGVSFLGLGSAFWGVVIGLVAYEFLKLSKTSSS